MTLTEAWCRTYTALVPEDEAGRRRAEIASHVHEARAAGASHARLALQTALGALADLSWSDRVRRHRGIPPLLVVPLLDATTGAIVAGLLVLVGYAVATIPGSDPHILTDALSYLAALVASSGHVAALVRRRRRH